MPAQIETQNLSFTYENRTSPALKEINLKIKPGEFVLLAGASGSGKSTLLKCINGLIPHRYVGSYSGKVLINGTAVAESPFLRLSLVVGTVLQEVDKQLVASTVEEDIAFGPSNLAIERKEIEARVKEGLEATGIGNIRKRSVFALSGGQKQRVAISDALAMKPSILLFDEPLANLDSQGVKLMQEAFRRLHNDGKTIIVSEHRTEEVLAVRPDRIVVINDGRILEDSEDPRVLSDYASVIKVPAELALEGFERRGKPRSQLILGNEIVRCNNVIFDYPGGPRALDGVNLVICEGERMALLGNNGAGKSTLGLCLAGLVRPVKGDVLVEGTSTRLIEVSRVARSVAIVFQSPFSMLFSKTVREELAFGPKNIGLIENVVNKVVMETAESCQIAHLLEGSPFATSFGEKKRICVASVLAMLPKCVILDEPTAGQDYRSYTAFMDFVNSLGSKVKSYVVITHDPDLAIEYTDRTVVMSGGKVIADGPTRTVLADKEILERGAIRETSLIRLSKEATGGKFVLPLTELARMRAQGML